MTLRAHEQLPDHLKSQWEAQTLGALCPYSRNQTSHVLAFTYSGKEGLC